MVPMLGFRHSDLGEGFINAYLSKIDDNYVIYFVFYSISEGLDATIKHNPYFLDSFSTDKLDYYVFDIPSEYENDFNLILEGKYSKIDNDLKTIILKNTLTPSYYRHKPTRQTTKIYGILYKTDVFRHYLEKKLNADIDPDNELWEMFDIDEETIDIDELENAFELEK